MAATTESLTEALLRAASDASLSDTEFREKARRLAARLAKLLGVTAAPAAKGRATAKAATTAKAAATAKSPYVFLAVPTSDGQSTSVSIARELFDSLSRKLGGREAAVGLARKAALQHKPESGVSRSSFVRSRLQRQAERAPVRRAAARKTGQ